LDAAASLAGAMTSQPAAALLGSRRLLGAGHALLPAGCRHLPNGAMALLEDEERGGADVVCEVAEEQHRDEETSRPLAQRGRLQGTSVIGRRTPRHGKHVTLKN